MNCNYNVIAIFKNHIEIIQHDAARGPGSIPGVGICFLALSFSIQGVSRNYTVIAIFKNHIETIQHDGQGFLNF